MGRAKKSASIAREDGRKRPQPIIPCGSKTADGFRRDNASDDAFSWLYPSYGVYALIPEVTRLRDQSLWPQRTLLARWLGRRRTYRRAPLCGSLVRHICRSSIGLSRI